MADNMTGVEEEKAKELALASARRARMEAEGAGGGGIGVGAARISQIIKGEVETGARLTRRLNKGVLDLITMPSNLINAGIGMVEYGLDTDKALQAKGIDINLPGIGGNVEGLKQTAYKWGITPDPEVPAETIPERTMEILGASTIPVLALAKRGNQVLQSAKKVGELGWLDNLARLTAKHPYTTAIMEPIASGTAATAGKWARESGASEYNVLMAELLGGFSPAVLIGGTSLLANVSFLRGVADNLRRNFLPFTRKGAEVASARRLQELSADPERAAARIDIEGELPAARQAAVGYGERKLLSLERAVLDADPVMDAEFEQTLVAARKALAARAAEDFPGDVNRTKELLRIGRDYIVNLVNLRSAQAGRDVAAAVKRLDPNTPQREINRVVREILDVAYRQARDTETELYNVLDSSAGADFTNARAALNAELASRSRYDDPEEIPKWLIQALKPKEEFDAATIKSLEKQGLIDENGEVLPAARAALEGTGLIKEETLTFNDLKALRTRILREMKRERAKDVPNRNKIRILNDVIGNEEKAIKGIMDDMEAAGVEGFDAARAFSRQLNLRFTQGNVGKLLNFEASGAPRVAEEITLDYLLAGKNPVTNIKQLAKADPDILPKVETYIKQEFLSTTTKESGFDRPAAIKFIAQWERRGVFEVLPELRAQLEGVKNLEQGASHLGIRAKKIRSLAYKSGKSRAALYLDSDPGGEMKILLNHKKPATYANWLIKKIQRIVRSEAMAQDPNSGSLQERTASAKDAINGLKTSFIEEGLARSGSESKFLEDGTPLLSGAKFTSFLKGQKQNGVMRALGFDEGEINKLERFAASLRQIDAKPDEVLKGVMEDLPSSMLDLLARFLGARAGGRLGTETGSSLVLAGAFSERMRSVLLKLTRNHAREMIIAAHQNTPEGRALYRVLLTRSTDDPTKQQRAANTVKAWMVGVGAVELSDMQEQ